MPKDCSASSISRLVNGMPGVAPLLGIRAALRSAGATAMLLASIAAVTAVLATVVFTTSLNALVATPAPEVECAAGGRVGAEPVQVHVIKMRETDVGQGRGDPAGEIEFR